MKKGLVILLAALILTGAAMAQLSEKMEELNSIVDYVKQLDLKIEAARTARQINKISELKEAKRQQLVRAKDLKAEIGQLKSAGPAEEPAYPQPKAVVIPKPVVAVQTDSADEVGAWYGQAGYLGGAFNVGISNGLSYNKISFFADGGIAIGNGYSVLTVGASKLFPIGQNKAGIKLALHSLSADIADVAGMTGTIKSGTKLGIEAFADTKVNDYQVRIGFNTALGLTFGVVRAF